MKVNFDAEIQLDSQSDTDYKLDLYYAPNTIQNSEPSSCVSCTPMFYFKSNS
jgi:hypothetical protein